MSRRTHFGRIEFCQTYLSKYSLIEQTLVKGTLIKQSLVKHSSHVWVNYLKYNEVWLNAS
jgi:hypothetical protein